MAEPKKYCTTGTGKESIEPIAKAVPKDDDSFEGGAEFFPDEDIVDLPLDNGDWIPEAFEEGPPIIDGREETTDELSTKVESICETHPSSIGCKVLGEQFIYHIQGLIKDIEEVKPAGYILAISKLKGAIIKLQAGD